MARAKRTPPKQKAASEVPYVVLLGGDVTSGKLDSDNNIRAEFDVVVVRMTHAPGADLGLQLDINVAIFREDAIQLAEAILAEARSLPIGG